MEKEDVQEEKIVYNDDKIHPSGGAKSSFAEKILSPEDNKTPQCAGKERYVVLKEKLSSPIILLGSVVIIWCVAGISTWSRVKENRNRTSAEAAIKTNTMSSMASGMAAMQWLDLEGKIHYRMYFQDPTKAILESAWDSNSTGWKVSVVANPDLKVQNRSSLLYSRYWLAAYELFLEPCELKHEFSFSMLTRV
jgi:hypothetical protein